MQHSALVVIDLQNDITKYYKEIIEKVNTAIDWAVKKNLWIIYIQHNNLSAGTRTFKPGTRGAELVPEMNVVSEHIFTKTKSNALTSEAFTAFLQEHGITDFYIAGADAAACIKSTCYNMAKKGYTVHVLSDCITSYDKKKLPEIYNNSRCVQWHWFRFRRTSAHRTCRRTAWWSADIPRLPCHRQGHAYSYPNVSAPGQTGLSEQ